MLTKMARLFSIGREEDGVGTEPLRHGRGHPGVNAVSTDLVTG